MIPFFLFFLLFLFESIFGHKIGHKKGRFYLPFHVSILRSILLLYHISMLHAITFMIIFLFF